MTTNATSLFNHAVLPEKHGNPKPKNISSRGSHSVLLQFQSSRQQFFERDFNWQTDYVYTPAGIDEVEEGKRGIPFMLLDVNKHANSTFQSLHCFRIIKCNKAMYEGPLQCTS
jgi:hypothetical protein